MLSLLNQNEAVIVLYSGKFCGACQSKIPQLLEFTKAHPEIAPVYYDTHKNGFFPVSDLRKASYIPDVCYYENGNLIGERLSFTTFEDYDFIKNRQQKP